MLAVVSVSQSIFAQVNPLQIITVERSPDFESLSAPDSNGNRHTLKMPSTKRSGTIKIPYPIIFIHGLNSNSDVAWNTFTDSMDAQFGFSYGGRLDYCLNYDQDYEKATSSADIALFAPSLEIADYYYLNFDVESNGGFDSIFYNVLSNQAAIAKQGIAISSAINYILKKTGRDKVILVGHSMGGLASREYLQNPSLWQSDGKHHVAKLVTTGTPHGGSNSSLFGAGFFFGLDEKSEACRDLRRVYDNSSDSGVYLYGGYENHNTMNQSFWYYHNVDVNCNGIVNEKIIGLNKKPLYYNLDYSCIIGLCTGCMFDINSGDGVVNEYCADLTNFYPDLIADLLYYKASAVNEIHTDLTNQIYQNMQGLDEPCEYSLAYDIKFGIQYTGFMTVQADNNQYAPIDYDDYRFSVSEKTHLRIEVRNLPFSNMTIRLVDQNENIIGSWKTENYSGYNVNQLIEAGTYYLEIVGIPNNNSWKNPYTFTLFKGPLAEFTANKTNGPAQLSVVFTDRSTGNPTSWQWSFPGGTPSTSTLTNPTVIYKNQGIYPVTLTVTNAYGNSYNTKTDYIKVTTNVGIETIQFLPFSLYPNPANSIINIDIEDEKTGVLTIFDLHGREVQRNILNYKENSFDISELSQGIYLFQIEIGDEKYFTKVIIE